MTISVQYGPGSNIALSPPDTTYTRTEGDTLPDITCSADCRPGCTFVWTRPDNTNFTVSPVLSLGQLDRSEHGTYRCTTRNDFGEANITTSVIVQYNPGTSLALSPPDTTYTRTEGDTLPDITCTADCLPDCTFVWTRPDNTNFTVSPVLSLGQLDRSEHGTYRCSVRNVIGESTINTSVFVQYPPQIVNLTHVTLHGNLSEGNSTSLVCTVKSFPASTIEWFFEDNDTVLLTSSDVLMSTFTLTNAGCLDTGLYTCSVRNSVSTTVVTRDIPINVLCKPRADPRISVEEIFGLSTSENLTVAALFLANPKPIFIWEFKNTSFVNETELVNGTDNFETYSSYVERNVSAVSVGIRTNMQEKWYGTYDVTATNTQGSGMMRFTVKAQGRPNAPYGESVICPFQDKAILRWISAFDGGSAQIFRIGRKSKTQDTYIIDREYDTSDPGQHQTVNISITRLDADTQHFFVVYAVNKFGNSSIGNEVNCTTQASAGHAPSTLGPILGAVGGSVAAVIVCALVVVIVITVRRKSRRKCKDDDTEMITAEIHTECADGLKPNVLYESSDGLKPNVLYESSDGLKAKSSIETTDPQPGSSSEYAIVQKATKSASPNDVYAVVNKSKKENSKAKNDVYAEVAKPKGKALKGQTGAKGGKGGKGKHKKEDARKAAVDAYENVEGINGASDNIYSNCQGESVATLNKEPSQKKNKDGLIYLDIEFNETNQNGRNYVIHGIENKTDYAEVDFTKRADPLPPEDTDTKQTGDAENIK